MTTPTRAPQDDRVVVIGPVTNPPSAEWIQGNFTDLPVPEGFALETNESFVFVQGSLRSADLSYSGTQAVSEVIRFYQDSMPTHGWRFLRMTGVRMKTLAYLSGDEICEIIMETHAPHDEHEAEEWHESGRENVTHLHIKLHGY